MNKCNTSPVRPDGRTFSFFLLIGLLACASSGNGQGRAGIANPVLPDVKDAGVLHYNGEYYIGGVSTNGGFYVSSDLLRWEGPYHVFSMDNDWTSGPSAHDSQIHASDIHYLNGLFHHYWSVNYWGQDQHVVHIGHATSPDVLGPYREPVKNTWLANRIDPHLFKDKDGKLYLYMVKFTDGNTIWARPMKDPGSFSGAPRYLFASLPGTWETRDNRVAEGPWVITYRDRYYMMYNANHTSPAWGNYALGVAQAAGPLEFNQASKYPHPVVQSNQEDLEDRYPDLLKYDLGHPFLYTVESPGENWNLPGFDDSAWEKGEPGYGSEKVKHSATRNTVTSWKSDRIWVRTTFSMQTLTAGNLSLRLHHDGATRVFLNGTLIYRGDERAYQHWNFDEEARALLKEGENLLAVESRAGSRTSFLDISLFDLKDQRADDILFSPGQPNMVRGPNGFEWWLVYMANKNAESRGQYINRIHFFNKKLTVEGITARHTPGYHPIPAAPTFGDLFNGSPAGSPNDHWQLLSGSWTQENKELVQLESAAATALPRSRPATHYLFEANVKMRQPGTKNTGRAADPDTAYGSFGQAGIYAWWKDGQNWLRILLDRERGKWSWELLRKGDRQTASYSLPDDFNYQVYHKLTVYKNENQFRVHIDGIPAPGDFLIQIPGPGETGLPGLYAGCAASFDGVVYTIGWDESDRQIAGWSPSAAAAPASGDAAPASAAAPASGNTAPCSAQAWNRSEEGIGPGEVSGRHAVFKGDPLAQYEFSLQVTFPSIADSAEVEAANSTAGIYAVYVDEANYIKAAFDRQARQLIISGKKEGKSLETHRLPLTIHRPIYADMRYSDFIEKHFTFDAPAWIGGLRLGKIPHGQPDTLLENIHGKMHIYYQLDGRWHPLENYRDTVSSHPGFEEIVFAPVKASAFKLVNKKATDHQWYVYKLWTKELFSTSSHLRVVKLKDGIRFWVNGKEMLRIPNGFSASRVGLITENSAARFNGITCYDLNSR